MRFLFVDKILSLQSGEYVRGIKHVTNDDYYCGIQDNKRYFLPAFIGETLGQLAAWNVISHVDFKYRPVAGIAQTARIFRPAYVGETILLESFIDSLDEKAVQYHSKASIDNEIIFEIEGAIGPLLPMQDFIDESVVRGQCETLLRHCEPQVKQSRSDWIASPAARNDGGFDYDNMLTSTPGQSITAIKRISPTAPYFADHFPNSPVLPMTVLLACKEQLVGEFLKHFDKTYKIVEMRRIKMNEFIRPNDLVTSEIVLKEQTEDYLRLQCQSKVKDKRVCTVEFYLISSQDYMVP